MFPQPAGTVESRYQSAESENADALTNPSFSRNRGWIFDANRSCGGLFLSRLLATELPLSCLTNHVRLIGFFLEEILKWRWGQ
jgi:hypothetical protein